MRKDYDLMEMIEHKPKLVLRIRPNERFSFKQPISLGYVPKQLNELLENYQYNPTPRLKKALSGNFHKQKEQK